MNTLPLHIQHQALGATFQTHGDWEIPAHYGNPQSEYEALHTNARVSRLIIIGEDVIVTGDDRITWLQSIISQDILPLQPGQGRYSTFMDHKGKMLSYFRVFIRPEQVVIEDVGEVGEQTYAALRKFLLYGTKAKMGKGIETQGLLLLSGPKAAGILKEALGVEVENLASLQSMSFSFEGAQGFIARTEETGMVDFELFAPLEVLPALWTHLLKTGGPVGLKPIGEATLETARIEAGLPRLGPDINERIVPPEANLEGIAFSLSKGCYPGQEVVARMDTYGSVKRRLVGLVIEGTRKRPTRGRCQIIFWHTRSRMGVECDLLSPTPKTHCVRIFVARFHSTCHSVRSGNSRPTKFPASVSTLPFTPPT